MSEMTTLGIVIYSIGLFGWYWIWSILIGFPLLSKMKLLHFPFWGAQFVFLVNIWLAYYAKFINYQTELNLYAYVENDAKSIAGMSLAIAVFAMYIMKDRLLEQTDVLLKLFLWLLFWAFLLSVIGTLPLYWMPSYGLWLTALRHLKCIPYFYALFILASALIVFLYELSYRREDADTIPPLTLGKGIENTADQSSVTQHGLKPHHSK